MKKNTGNKIRLGIFISAGFMLFIAAIYFVGQKQQLFSSSFHITGVFKDVSGLQVGNNVRFSGINVGIVEEIQQITDSTVRVSMMIDENSRKFIKKNAKAIIGSDGLMGNKIMLIIPGTVGFNELVNNDTLQTSQPVSMDEIMLSMKVTSENAASITGDLAAIMKNIHEGKGTIGKLFMDSTMAENVGSAMFNIKEGAGGFKTNMDAAGNSFLLKGFAKKKTKAKEVAKEKVQEDVKDKEKEKKE